VQNNKTNNESGTRVLTTNIDGDPFETQDTKTPESEVSARHLQANNEGEAAGTYNTVETDAQSGTPHESIVGEPNSREISSQVPIDSIKIGSRFRKDLGDIASFAKDISEIGLLHPIAINQNRELISGLRRIEAFKLLGRNEIPAHIVNLDDIVKGEVSENTQRKDFSWEEIIRIKKAVEPEIKKESEKRMLSGKPSAKFADGSDSSSTSNIKTTSKNYSENQTRAKVARYVSLYGKKISHTTLAMAEKVYDAAQQEPATFGQIWTDLNSEKISPSKAYKKMQRIRKRQNEIVEPQPYTTDYDYNGKEVMVKSSRRDVIECEHCQIKDFRIKELEDALRETTQLRPANQISEGKDDNIKQLAKEFLDLEVQDIRGIGPTTVRKLNEAGIVTVMDLAVSRPDELAVDINASKESAAAFIMAAQKLLRDSRIIDKEFLTADLVLEKRKSMLRCSTGSRALDELLLGGIETQAVTEFYGEFGSGKSEICHTLCAMARQPIKSGGLDSGVIYIDTEGTFRPERLEQIATARGLDHRHVLESVAVCRVYNSSHLELVLKDLSKYVSDFNTKLVIIDGIIVHRGEFIGRGILADRQQRLDSILHKIIRLAQRFNIAVVITNQVATADPTKAACGNVVAHSSTYRIYLRKSGENRLAKMMGSPSHTYSETRFIINQKGADNIEEEGTSKKNVVASISIFGNSARYCNLITPASTSYGLPMCNTSYFYHLLPSLLLYNQSTPFTILSSFA
jgi:DNA repair protein RadA